MEHNGYDYRLQEKINSVSEYVEMISSGDLDDYMNVVKGLFLSALYAQGHNALCSEIALYFKDLEDDELDLLF